MMVNLFGLDLARGPYQHLTILSIFIHSRAGIGSAFLMLWIVVEGVRVRGGLGRSVEGQGVDFGGIQGFQRILYHAMLLQPGFSPKVPARNGDREVAGSFRCPGMAAMPTRVVPYFQKLGLKSLDQDSLDFLPGLRHG